MPDSPANYCRIWLRSKSVHSSPFFSCFSSAHGTLCKIYLDSRQWRVKISYYCLITSWRISRSHLDIRKKCQEMFKYLVYLINSKITYDCLIWIIFYREFNKPSFLAGVFLLTIWVVCQKECISSFSRLLISRFRRLNLFWIGDKNKFWLISQN